MTHEVVRSLTAGRVRYSYRLLRQGPPVIEPVLVLGGVQQGMHGWPYMDDALGPLADVVTADLPGMASADPLPDGPALPLAYTAIAQILDDLRVPRVNLFGFSYGADLAYGFTRRFPHRVARLALGGVPAHVSDAQAAALHRAEAHLDRGDVRTFAALVADSLLCTDSGRYIARRDLAHRYVRRTLAHTVRHSPHAAESLRRAVTERTDYTGGLTGVPALVFCGEHDTVTSPDRQRAFAGTIADSRFLTIPDSDHWVVLQRPHDVADLAARFFTGRSLADAPCRRRVPRPSGAVPAPRAAASEA